MNTPYYIYTTALAALFLSGCSSNDDIGRVSSDYMSVKDVVMQGSNTSGTLHIDADCHWTVSSGESWVTVSPAQGEGVADVTLTTGVNPSAVSERSAQITVKTDGGVERVVMLKQTTDQESLEVSTSEISFGEERSQLDFTITSNTTWTITGGADWLSLSITEGHDNSSITVTAQQNETEYDRSAVLTVTGANRTTAQVAVTQLGKTVSLTIEPERIEAAAKGAAYTFQIMGTATWTAISEITSWVTLDRREGQGNAVVNVTLSDNASSDSRSATIRVTSASGKIERTCTVVQAGATPPLPTVPVISAIERYTAVASSTFQSPLDVENYGFCYALTANPTISDASVTATGDTGMSGSFTSQLSGLTSGRTYHVRAWARNANGIGYSEDTTFTLKGDIPGEGGNPTPNL